MIVPISFFAAIVIILYVYFTTRHRERIAMIEKGVDPASFQTKLPKLPGFLSWLSVGLFIIGIGIGLILGNIIALHTELMEPTAYISMMCLFGGLGLIAGTLIVERKRKKKYGNE